MSRFENRLNELFGLYLSSIKFPDKKTEAEIKRIAEDFHMSVSEVRKAFHEKTEKFMRELETSV